MKDVNQVLAGSCGVGCLQGEREEEINQAFCLSVLVHTFHSAYDLQSGNSEINLKCHLCSKSFCSSLVFTWRTINPVSGIYSLLRSGPHHQVRLRAWCVMSEVAQGLHPEANRIGGGLCYGFPTLLKKKKNPQNLAQFYWAPHATILGNWFWLSVSLSMQFFSHTLWIAVSNGCLRLWQG